MINNKKSYKERIQFSQTSGFYLTYITFLRLVPNSKLHFCDESGQTFDAPNQRVAKQFSGKNPSKSLDF